MTLDSESLTRSGSVDKARLSFFNAVFMYPLNCSKILLV